MELAQTIESVRELVKQARSGGKTVGFVPTMGALHIGHISLIEAAVKRCGFVVVSIFVNPTQFGPTEDMDKYPRPIEQDMEICRNAGVDLVFNPPAEQMYPAKNLTWVDVEKLTEPLCGLSRKGHFRGVTTVCTKLFNIVSPDIAFFGQKDAQQAIVITQMVADLNMPLEIAICPTVRDDDGLAVSGRNKYLNADQRRDALLINKSPRTAREAIESGVTDVELITAQMRKVLSRADSIEPEYLSIVDALTLENVDRIAAKVLIAVAARLGQTRLIDNIIVDMAE